MYRTVLGWKALFEDLDALWLHDGNPYRHHAELSSGGHSNGFCNSEKFLERPSLVDHAARDLMESLEKAGLKLDLVDRVVGPAMGAITLAHDLARHIGRECSKACCFSYAEKAGDEGGAKKMAFRRMGVAYQEKVLLAEDVLTTGSSVLRVKKAVEDAGGLFEQG